MDKKKEKVKEKVKRKEDSKNDPRRPRSKTTVECKTSECKVLHQKYRALEEDAEGMKKKITELDADREKCLMKISQRELERDKAIDELVVVRDKAIDELAVVQAEAQVFKIDFEEERRDRERIHQELEELKNGSLEDEERKKELANSEVKIGMLHQHIAAQKEEMAINIRKNDRYVEKCENELFIVNRELEHKNLEIQQLRDGVPHQQRNDSPENFYTLKDQLDIANSMCKNLHREKQEAQDTVQKLRQEISDLRSQNRMRHRDSEVFSPIDGSLSPQMEHGTLGHDHSGTCPDHGPCQPFDKDTVESLAVRPVHNNQERTSYAHPSRESLQRPYMYSTTVAGNIQSKTQRSASEGQVVSYGQDIQHQQGYPSRGMAPPISSQVSAPCEYQHEYYQQTTYGEFGNKETRSNRLADDNELNYTRAFDYISLEIGELSETEKSSLKGIVENWKYYQEDELDNDIRMMCDQMKGLRHEQLIRMKTDIHMALDPNLVCPNCKKQYRDGEIQKFKDHAVHCQIKW